MSDTNAEQIEYWNEQAGPTWVAMQEALDEQIGPLGLEAMDRAEVQAGEGVIDIGCGCGQSSIELARRVGASGSVLGVDISAPMLARARERAADLPQARFLQADAQSHAFDPGAADLLFSRFGVMFFEDPAAAFANLRKALRPGGRLVFLCWRGIQFNPWMREPMAAIAELVEMPPPPPPDAPGPMAFADDARVEGLFRDAGFEAVESEAFDTKLTLAGGGDLDAAADFMLKIGPAARIAKASGLSDLGPMRDRIRSVLETHQTPDGIRMDGAVWFYRARNGG